MEFDIVQPFIRSVSLSPFFWKNKYATISYDARLFYIYNGSGKITLEKTKTIYFSTDDLLIIPPGTFYDFQLTGDSFELFAVNFDFTRDHCNIENMMNVCFENNYDPKKILSTPIPEQLSKPIYLRKKRSVRTRLFNMLQEFQFKNLYKWDKISVILKDILIDIARTQCDTKTTVSEPIAELLNYIHLHYAENITYEDISDHFSYHPYYLNRKLKSETGKTIFQYLLDYRLKVAAQLILSGSLSLEEIAFNTGFKTPSHFSKCFKARYNIPPREYKQKYSI